MKRGQVLGGVFAAVLALAWVPERGHAQTVTEFSAGITAGAQPLGISIGPDGNRWFTEVAGNRIGRITPTGVVTEFSAGIGAGAGLRSITAGPDGNLWFTEFDGNRIGRITPAGVVTEFSTGISAGARPEGIAAGPDGNLWFTEFGGNRIGRITPAGVVTEFSTGITSGARPWGITTGPDGNLWFTEYEGNRIGRITPDGIVTEFGVGISTRSIPLAIVSGPDGNLWFTEGLGNRIARITPDGVVTEFGAGISAGAHPEGITVGPDGNLWFTEIGIDRVGRITPAGVVTEFSAGISVGAGPARIVPGPDGTLWFTEAGGNRIGRLASPGTLQFSTTHYPANEHGGSVTVTVTRTGGSSGAASVQYIATSGGTATPGDDYTLGIGTLTWADGDSAPKTFTVPIVDDALVEGNETVGLGLVGATGATIGGLAAANIEIIDDDGTPGISLPATGMFFGGVQINSPSIPRAMMVTSTSTGTARLNIGGLSLSGVAAGDYAIHSDTCTGASLAPAASCIFEVIFTPSAAGVREASIALTSNAGVQNLSLNGTGTLAPSGDAVKPVPTLSQWALVVLALLLGVGVAVRARPRRGPWG